MTAFGSSSAEVRAKAQSLCEQAKVDLAHGDRIQAMGLCHRALSLDYNCLSAHLLFAKVALVGMDYMEMLAHIHEFLQPRTYLEIGVDNGYSIALAHQDTLSIGVDPAPQIACVLHDKVRIFNETSDDFFAKYSLAEEFCGISLDLAFIDGKHQFEYALRDFLNIERNSGPTTTVLIHDCYPLDEMTATRDRRTTFWSGDVWKLVMCLKKYRPDLQINTLAAPWTGLGLVRGLDRTSTVLSAQLDILYSEFVGMPYAALAKDKCAALNLVPGDWDTARRLLSAPIRRPGI